MTVLASKQHYCINEKVMNHPELNVDEICGHEIEIEDLMIDSQSEQKDSIGGSIKYDCLINN